MADFGAAAAPRWFRSTRAARSTQTDALPDCLGLGLALLRLAKARWPRLLETGTRPGDASGLSRAELHSQAIRRAQRGDGSRSLAPAFSRLSSRREGRFSRKTSRQFARAGLARDYCIGIGSPGARRDLRA